MINSKEDLMQKIIEWQGIMLNNYANKVEELSVYKAVLESLSERKK